MNVIQRIRFPKALDVAGLYLNVQGPAMFSLGDDEGQIIFKRGGLVSFNAYFNSFYENFYATYTDLGSVYYVIRLEGDFRVAVCRERWPVDREVLCEKIFGFCREDEPLRIPLTDPAEKNAVAGRIYLEIECTSERGIFYNGCLATDQEKVREVSLAIVSTTYRKEDFIRRTVRKITEDRALMEESFRMFVVDNGRTLDRRAFPEGKIRLVPNRNLGGSGGFNRGLMEAMREGSFTHILFMDDDIELETESIWRAIRFFEFAKDRVVLAGNLLEITSKNTLYEAGALAGGVPREAVAPLPFNVMALKRGVRLQEPEKLNWLIQEEVPDYGAFWFFAFPVSLIEKTGFLPPFFMYGDDIAFGLKLTHALGWRIVALPGVAVWHHTWWATYLEPVFTRYYWIRNFLVIYSVIGLVGPFRGLGMLTKEFLDYLCSFDYLRATMMEKAISDWLEGPALFEKMGIDELHERIVALAERSQTRTRLDRAITAQDMDMLRQDKWFAAIRIVLGYLTLNGHLIPGVFLRGGEVMSYERYWWKTLWRRTFVIYKGSSGLYVNRMNRKLGLMICLKWFFRMLEAAWKWQSVSKLWRERYDFLTSADYWEKFFADGSSGPEAVQDAVCRAKG